MTDLETIADRHDLGPHVATLDAYRSGAAGTIAAATVLTAAVSVPLGFLAEYLWGVAPWSAVLPAAVIALTVYGFGRWAFRTIRDDQTRLHLYENGVVVQRRSAVSAFPAHDTALYSHTREHQGRKEKYDLHQCVLRRGDGTAAVLGMSSSLHIRLRGEDLVPKGSLTASVEFREFDEWVPAIEKALGDSRLPALEEAFDQGESLEFGPLSVSRDRVRGDVESFSREEVDRVSVDDDTVRAVIGDESRDLTDTAAPLIPDLYLFLRFAARQ
ncbi:DUF6585 family protein [Salininema proteolyticum]|uniref:DUF6585 family protein n=1 Tax=Salininema proteolyticum TaxID=1607685 RepID=A0ABV8TWF2_9ACTN